MHAGNYKSHKIRTLMPKYPIYINSYSKSANTSISKVPCRAVPLQFQNLQNELSLLIRKYSMFLDPYA